MIQQQQMYLLELYRAGFRTTCDMMRASLESAQRLQSQQAEAVRSALEDTSKSARELSEARSLDEIVALQTRTIGGQMERATELWSRLWRTASEGQVAMLGQVQNQVGQIGDTMRNTYSAGARAAEDTARTVAAHAANAASNHERNSRQERKAAS